MSWTDTAKQQLKALWADGLSASQIAGEIGGITRNAVIGQVHRMGLSGRARTQGSAGAAARHMPNRIKRRAAEVARTLATTPLTAQPKPKSSANNGGHLEKKVIAKAKAPAEIDGATEVQDLPADESSFAVTFAALAADQCRWPLGDPSNFETFRFCGAPQIAKCPYCLRHAMTAGAGYGRRTVSESRVNHHPN